MKPWAFIRALYMISNILGFWGQGLPGSYINRTHGQLSLHGRLLEPQAADLHHLHPGIGATCCGCALRWQV